MRNSVKTYNFNQNDVTIDFSDANLGDMATIVIYDFKGEIIFFDEQNNITDNKCSFSTNLDNGNYHGKINGIYDISIIVNAQK